MTTGPDPDLASADEADWFAALEARADRPPRLPREPLWLAGPAACVGSIEPALAQRLVGAGLPLVRGGNGWAVTGVDVDASLAAMAAWLRDAGLGNGWRGELLAVCDATGRPHAAIERAAVRPLGIATHAVHLMALDAAGSMWVQQRADDKQTDPGRWDTTMGGLRTAGESAADTLHRETWEEAGLQLDAVLGLAFTGRCTVRRPLAHGYMLEYIESHVCVLPVGRVPVNQDGEVQGFNCLPLPALRQRLFADAFTLEAALVLAQWLRRPGATAG